MIALTDYTGDIWPRITKEVLSVGDPDEYVDDQRKEIASLFPVLFDMVQIDALDILRGYIGSEVMPQGIDIESFRFGLWVALGKSLGAVREADPNGEVDPVVAMSATAVVAAWAAAAESVYEPEDER